MYYAIQKYGWNNIEHNILFENLSEKEAKEKEIELIKKYHTFIHDENSMGYNMTLGGEGTTGHKFPEEQIEKHRKRLLGKTGKECVNSKPVICDGIEYESLTQFRQLNNNPDGNINGWLNGKVGMPKEWYDKKLHYKDTDFSIIKLSKERSKRRVILYDNKVFKSQKSVAHYIGVSPSQVCMWLKGKEPMPREVKDKGLMREDGTHTISEKEQKHPFREKVFFNGKIYNSQAELAKELNIKKETLWTYLNGKVKHIPQYLIDGNLHKI